MNEKNKIALLENELKITKNKLLETEMRIGPTIEDCMTFGYTRGAILGGGGAFSGCMDEWRKNGRKPKYTYVKSFWEKVRDLC